MNESMVILLQLLLAHILADFVLQPTPLVNHKRKFKGKSWFLYIHSLLAGGLSLLFLQSWEWWFAAAFIGVTHFFIDLWKLQHKKDNLRIFLVDQFWHLIIIFMVWLYIIKGFSQIIPWLEAAVANQTYLAISIGFLIIIYPTGFLIGKATQRWQEEIEITSSKTSLEAAGRYIGIFERILVLTFILTDNFSAIGFLIAAKSILRFSDKTETGARKQTEYVLIGTLMSFSITIIIGLILRYLSF